MPKLWLSEPEIAAFLATAPVGRLGTCHDGQPYVTPMCFVYDQDQRRFYLHSRGSGRKMANLQANPHVCFEVDAMDGIRLGASPCKHGMRYTSVIASGQARVITDAALKRRALELLAVKYAGPVPDGSISEAEVGAVTVVEIVVETMTGKRDVD